MASDARVRYTKKVIRESFLHLLKSKPIQKITVKEICAKAEINRATFYSHYRDPYDLLQQIEDELFEDLSTKVVKKYRYDNLTAITQRAFEIIASNIELCRILFSGNGTRQFLDRVMSLARETTISGWKAKYPRASRYQIEFLFQFFISGCVAVLEHWVKIGMKETPIELGEFSIKLADLWFRKK